jgi:4a-hydroxytetrahydrobiopterin dehydratase
MIMELKKSFQNFSQALSFIVQVGILAEKQGHHPELLMFTIKSTFD